MFHLQMPVIAALATMAGYGVLLILALRRRPHRSQTERLVLFYLGLSAFWTLALAIQVWQGLQPWFVAPWSWVAWLGPVALSVLLAILALEAFIYPGGRWVGALGVGCLLVLLILARRLGDVNAQEIIVLRVGAWTGFTGGALAVVLLNYVRLTRPLYRNRALYWLIALSLVAIGEALIPAAGLVLPVRQLGLPTRLIGVGLLAYAVFRYSLPDVKRLVRQAVATGVVGVIAFALYLVAMQISLTIYQMLAWTPLPFAQRQFLGALAAIFVAFLLMVVHAPLNRAVRAGLGRLLIGEGYNPAQAVRTYSQRVSNIVHLERLAETAVKTISEVLGVRRGALLLVNERDSGGAEVRVVPGMGEMEIREAHFSPHSPVLESLKVGQPVTQYDIDMHPRFRGVKPSERKWQWDLDMEVWVPIHARRTLIGILALGAKGSGEPYTGQDLELLVAMAGQTAVALENARLFEDLQQKHKEISQLNEDLRQAYQQLRKLDKAKSDFINIASHELRTPLTQVRGYADILADMVQTGDVNQAYLLKTTGGIRKATDRLERIISAMLDASEISAEALRLVRTEVRLSTVVKMAADRWKEALELRQQHLAIVGLDELPPIQADQQRLVQAFSHLINNAIKYTPDGGRIEVRGQLVDEDEGIVHIIVADTGIGIAPEEQELIFEPFYRVGSADLHSTGTVKFKGAGPGLGLPIAKGVIEAHGGTIWVESEGYDEVRCLGSSFHILLPLRGEPISQQSLDRLTKTRPMGGLSESFPSQGAVRHPSVAVR